MVLTYNYDNTRPGKGKQLLPLSDQPEAEYLV